MNARTSAGIAVVIGLGCALTVLLPPALGATRERGAGKPAKATPLIARNAPRTPRFGHLPLPPTRAARKRLDALTGVVQDYCTGCHSDEKKKGELSLDHFDVTKAAESAELAEKMINKLRAGMMPPPGKERPKNDSLELLAATLERLVDAEAAKRPDPGSRGFQRLNRAEYERSIEALLGLSIDAGSWLPLDTKSANFDNIADTQIPSATVLDGYLDAASELSRLAVGDAKASVTNKTYKIPRLASQIDHVPGAPAGTRGGLSVTHTFPADGEYLFRLKLHSVPTGELFGSAAPVDEKLEVSVDGERVAILPIDRGLGESDANGLEIRTPTVTIRAGTHRVSAAFLRTFEGPVNDLIAPIGHSIADTEIGGDDGITMVPHLREMVVTGPFNPTGVSETATRKRIFLCRPTSADEARPCAERILTSLASSAYRRPASKSDVAPVMGFYDEGAKQAGNRQGGFENGIRSGLEAILSSPRFIFRVESQPANAKPGERHELADHDLAARLSFFIWGTPPDATLTALAAKGKLRNSLVLAAQTRRMLADPRSEALATRFAAQWLRLQDVEKVHPDALQFPDYSQQLADAMRRETELFFYDLVREDKSVLDLYGANYTFMNEALAKHYGVKGVVGNSFRKVALVDENRRGLFGQASILTLTSHANRTSPVLRGKWVMEVLLGSPPPPPPPDVPDLEKTGESKDGRLLTTRERMEMHRNNASCRSCHAVIDPIGLSLDNYDVTGRWRIKENRMPLDTKGKLYDGTPVQSPSDLRVALLKRPTPLVRTFTQNLMAYALGRRIEFGDQPAVRKIVANASTQNHRMSAYVLGVAMSDAFRMTRSAVASSDSTNGVKRASSGPGTH